MRKIRIHAILFALFFLVLSAPASAEIKFYEAYRQGLDAEKAQSWKEAREHFALAARLNPVARRVVRIPGRAPIRHYDPYVHLAHCEGRLGMLVQAAVNLQKSREAGITPELILQDIQQHLEKGAEEARKRAEARKRLLIQSSTEQGVLRIESSPLGAIIFVDGIESGETPVELSLPAGAHSIKWVLTGYQPSEEKIEVQRGRSRTVSAMLALLPMRQTQTKQPAAVAESARGASSLQMVETPATVDDESEPASTPLAQREDTQNDQVAAVVADSPVRPVAAPAPIMPAYLLAGFVVVAAAIGAAVAYRKKKRAD